MAKERCYNSGCGAYGLPSGYIQCNYCKGTGKQLSYGITPTNINCYYCGGQGKKRCEKCGGTGYVDKSPSSSSGGSYSSSSGRSQSTTSYVSNTAKRGGGFWAFVIGIIGGLGIALTAGYLYVFMTGVMEAPNFILFSVLPVAFLLIFIMWRKKIIPIILILLFLAVPGYLCLFGVIPEHIINKSQEVVEIE